MLTTVLLLLYSALLIYTIIRILLDTDSTPKTLAYLLLVLIFPLFGIIFYFSFGINYRHKKTTQKRMESERRVKEDMKHIVPDLTEELTRSSSGVVNRYQSLVRFLHQIGGEKLSPNQVELLINGEEKFPEVLRELEKAEQFVHMEYYAWENDIRGNQIKEVLIRKLREGVKVRIMYDAYASRMIKKNIVKQLDAAGAEIHPVIEVKLKFFANRMNHRDHRKIIIIDGHTGFVGGINVSDRYDNSIDTGLFWRDTHVKIIGEAVHNMQRHFIVNWNATQKKMLPITKDLFPDPKPTQPSAESELVQMVAGGPIYDQPNIMLTYSKIFASARKKLYITNPYFIPSESITVAMKQAALSGVDVRLIVPKKSDSAIVGAASRFYFEELLRSGVRVFLYKKGFVHAKTVVADGDLSVVGTANMDIRSFDLNFEIMSIVYGEILAADLEEAFMKDLRDCDEITYEQWMKRGSAAKLIHAVARLTSPFL